MVAGTTVTPYSWLRYEKNKVDVCDQLKPMVPVELSRWVPCPKCGGKTRTKVYSNSALVKFPLFCPKCRKETLIDAVQLKMVLSAEPDV